MKIFFITLAVCLILWGIDYKIQFTKKLSNILSKSQYYFVEVISFLVTIILADTFRKYHAVSQVLFVCSIAILCTFSTYKSDSK